MPSPHMSQLPMSKTPTSMSEDDFTVVKSLGSGKYGMVQMVEKKDSKRRMAWKRLHLKDDPQSEVEVMLLGRLKHQGIVQMYEAYSDGVTADLLLELCSKGNMQDFLDSKTESFAGATCYSRPDDFFLASTLDQLLSAVEFLHQNRVAHRDIKPDNVLQSSKQQWKLADFNLACEFVPGESMTEYAGSDPYMAPEVKALKYNEKCDLYSMGVLFTALVHGKHYYRPEEITDSDEARQGKKRNEAVELLSEQRWKAAGLNREAWRLVQEMLAPQALRCDAQQALSHPWLKQYEAGGACCTVS